MWKTVKLGDACLVRRGTTITKKNAIEGDVPVIGGGTKPTYFHNEPNREASCITISGSGASAGFVNRWDLPIFASDCSTVEPKDEMQLPKFIYYYLLSQQQFIYDNFRSGAAQPHVYAKDIETLDFPILPLLEQERIVAKLDAAFAEIDEAEKIASSAADSARQLFKKELSLIFLASRSGWNNTTIVNCCQLKSGNTINKALEKTEGELPYLKVADMNLASNADGVITSSRFVLKADISDKAIIKKGSVIFPKRGGAIATNKKRLTLTDICADLNIMSVYPKASLIPELLYYFFKNIDMAMLGSGSSIPQINNYDIEPLSISYPIDKSEQLNLASRLKDLEYESERLAVTYQCKVAELVKLKSAILAQELKPSEAA